MNYAHIEVSGNTLRVIPERLFTTGAVGGEVTLSFDESWDGYTKTLVWRGSGVTVDDLQCTGRIPAQVLTKPGTRLFVGVYGTKGDTALPTLWGDLGILQPGTDPCGDESTDPTLPVWAQIPQYLETELQKAKDSGEFDGKPFTYEDFTDEQLEALKGEPGMVNLDDTKVGADGWSSKNIIDKLCLPFTKTGPVVTCQPMEGYPLCVTAQTAVTRTGKNLFGGKALLDALLSKDLGGGVTPDEENKTVTFNPGRMDRTGHLFNRFKENTAYTIILYGCNTLEGADGITNLRIQYTDNTSEAFYFNNGKLGADCAANELGYVIHKTRADKTLWRITPSWSNGATRLHYDKCGVFEGEVSLEAFEAYHGNTFAPSEPVPALAGVNTLWADTGDITVTGRADPLPLLQKLSSLSS